MSETQPSNSSIKVTMPVLVKSDEPNSDPKVFFWLSEVTEVCEGVYATILNTCKNFLVSNDSAEFIQTNKNLIALYSNIREEDLEKGINAYETEKNKQESIIKPPIKALKNNIISLNIVGSGDDDYAGVDESNENNLIVRFTNGTKVNSGDLPKNGNLTNLIDNGASSNQRHKLLTEINFVQNLHKCFNQINEKNYKEEDINCLTTDEFNIGKFILVEDDKLKFDIFDDKAKLNDNGNAIIEVLHKEYPFVEENIFKSYFENTLISGLSAVNYTDGETKNFIDDVKTYIANCLNENKNKGESYSELFNKPVIENDTIKDSFYALHYIQYLFYACMLHYLNEPPKIRESIFTNILDIIKIFEQDPKIFANSEYAEIKDVKSFEDIPHFFISKICPSTITKEKFNNITTTRTVLYNIWGSANAQTSTTDFHTTQNYLISGNSEILENSENKFFINKENYQIGIGFPAFYEYLTGEVLTKANSTEPLVYKLPTKVEFLEIEVYVSNITPRLLVAASVKSVINNIDVINKNTIGNFIAYLIHITNNDDYGYRKKYSEYINYFTSPDNDLGKEKQQEIFLMFVKHYFLRECTKNEIENLIEFYGISLIIPRLKSDGLLKLSIKIIIDNVKENVLSDKQLDSLIKTLKSEKQSEQGEKNYQKYIDYFMDPGNIKLDISKDTKKEIFFKFVKYDFLRLYELNEIENLFKNWGFNFNANIAFMTKMTDLLNFDFKFVINNIDFLSNDQVENLVKIILKPASNLSPKEKEACEKYIDFFKNPNDEPSIPKEIKKGIFLRLVENGFLQAYGPNESNDLFKNLGLNFIDIVNHIKYGHELLNLDFKIVIIKICVLDENQLRNLVSKIVDCQRHTFIKYEEQSKKYVDFFQNLNAEPSIPKENKKEIFLKLVENGFLRAYEPSDIKILIGNYNIDIKEIIPHMTVKQLESLDTRYIIENIKALNFYKLAEIFNTKDKKNKYLDALKQFRREKDKNNFFQTIINLKCFDKYHFNANDIIAWNKNISLKAFQELSFSSELHFNSDIISKLIGHFGNHEVAPEFLNKISCSLKKLLSADKNMACECVANAFNVNKDEVLFRKIVQYKDDISIFKMFSATLNSNFKDTKIYRYLNIVDIFFRFLFENRKKNNDFNNLIRDENILIENLFENMDYTIDKLLDFYDYKPWYKTDRLAKFPLKYISDLADFIMDPDKNNKRKKFLARDILEKSFDSAKLMQLPPAASVKAWSKLLMLDDKYKEMFFPTFSGDISNEFINYLISNSNEYDNLISNMLSNQIFKTKLENYINKLPTVDLINNVFEVNTSPNIRNLISKQRFKKFLSEESNNFNIRERCQILIVNFTANKFVKYTDYVPNNFFTGNIGSQEVKDAMPKISDQKFEEMFSGLNPTTVVPKDIENYFLYLNKHKYGRLDQNIKIKLNILNARLSSQINENEFKNFVRDFSKDKTEINLNELPSFMLEKVREKENNIPAQNNIQLNNRPENATPVTPNVNDEHEGPATPVILNGSEDTVPTDTNNRPNATPMTLNENNGSESLIIPNVNNEHENDVIMPYEKRDKIYKITGYASIFVSIVLIVLAAIFSLYILIPAAACFLYGGMATSSDSKSNNEKEDINQNTGNQNTNVPNQETPDDNRVPTRERVEHARQVHQQQTQQTQQAQQLAPINVMPNR